MFFSKTVLVFDFDGTMVDSLDSVVDKVNHLMKRLGQRSIREQRVERFLTGGANSSLRKWPIVMWLSNFLSKAIEAEQQHHLDELEPVPRLREVLMNLHRRGFRLGVVTSNNAKTVHHYLHEQRLEAWFDFVYTGAGLYGKDRLMQTMLMEQRLSKRQVVYIGDEPRDILTAKAVGVRAIAVTWGFQSKKALARVKPDWIIDHPADLLRVVESCSWWRRLIGWRRM